MSILSSMETKTVLRDLQRAELAPFMTIRDLYVPWLGFLRAVFIGALTLMVADMQSREGTFAVWSFVLAITVTLVYIVASSVLLARRRVRFSNASAPSELQKEITRSSMLHITSDGISALAVFLLPFPVKWMVPAFALIASLITFYISRARVESVLKDLQEQVNG